MRHRVRAHKLSRTSAHRKAMFRNLVTSLLELERVQTTDVKAKEVRRLADRMITLGKRGDLHARRQALAVIRHRHVTAKVFDELAERYRERPGGYTRVIKLGVRRGDAAPIALVELVDGTAGAAAPAKASAAEPAKPARKPGRAAAAAKAKPKAAAETAGKRKAPAQKAEKKKAPKPQAGGRKAGTRKTAARKTTRRKQGD
jgi:large subunit ribosomal protein L17